MPTFYVAPTQNYIQKTVSGAIDDTVTAITLSSTTNLQAPGVIVIDRVDSSGNLTPGNREVIPYTTIVGSQVTGCTRGGEGSTAIKHADGAVVETMPTVGMWNNLATIVASGFDSNGYLKAINSPASIAFAQLTQAAITSIASITAAMISTRLDVSGASVTGIGFFPAFRGSGGYSGPTTTIGGLLTAPKAGTLAWVSVLTRTVASAASVQFDFVVNGASVFAGITAPLIVGGGTYASTASINTKAILAGATLRADLKTLTSPGVITDVVIQAGTL